MPAVVAAENLSSAVRFVGLSQAVQIPQFLGFNGWYVYAGKPLLCPRVELCGLG